MVPARIEGVELMEPIREIDPEVKKQIKEAWSFPDDPPGEYIGSENQNGRLYHYYKKGLEYFYETDFDREMKAKGKAKRRQKREQRMGKANYNKESCGKL